MLSFLREPANGGAKHPGDQKSTASDKGKSGAIEDTSGQEYFTVASKSGNVRKSTALVAILFGIGIVCLWFMIQKSKPQGASAASPGTEEQQIEAAIGRLTGVSSEMLSRMDQIIEKFYEFSNVLQVRVDELVKNPFEFEQFLASLRSKAAAEDAQPENVNMELVLQQQRVKQEAGLLKLSSIMKSPQGNYCMINDWILREGDSIKSFSVKRIADRSVELVWNGETNNAGTQVKLDDVSVVLKLSQ